MKSIPDKRSQAFTLLEVVIALAVFAFLIGGLLGFLPWSVEGVSKVREQDTAYGLVDGVQVELDRMGFSMVEAGTKRLNGLYNAFDTPRVSSSPFDLLLVARRSGGQVAYEQVVEKTSLALLNSDQLEEGNNQDLLTKEMGGVV
jgi:prepilin-type N-terminal cleavage/methylation domain-containing protein